MVNLDITAGETLRLELPATLPDGFSAENATAHLRGPSAQNIPGAVAAGIATFAADSSAYPAGKYAVEVWGVSVSGEKRILDRGTAIVRASLAAVTGVTDLRTDNEKALENIRAMLAGTASQGVKSYTINNRTLERYSIGELLQLERRFVELVAREKRIAGGKSILGPRIAVRL